MKFLDCKRMALAPVLLPGVGVFAQTLTPVGVVAADKSNLVSDVVNAPTEVVSQAQLGLSAHALKCLKWSGIIAIGRGLSLT